jgi:histidine triad (HIT) family protein
VAAPAACVFDPIIAGRAAGHLVVEEAQVVAFLDARPVFPGHTLVVPRLHVETVAGLDADLAGRLWEVAARVAAAQRRALGAEGTFFGLNDVISQSVPHVHLHVVPRRRGDGLRGFFWPRSRYQPGEAEQVAAALRAGLASGPPAPAGGPLSRKR